jgi:hypothetical protein
LKYANIPSINNFWIVILQYCIFLFCSTTLIRFWCPIPNTPCNFEKFYIGNSACSNCFNKVVIFLKSGPSICGMSPIPHVRMPMMFNNMLRVNHTNKGCCTSCICCTWVWSSSHLYFAFVFTQSKAFFSFLFCLACRLFKIKTFIEVWSCHLRHPRRIDGCQDLPNCIWRPCVWSKCLRSNHLAT